MPNIFRRVNFARFGQINVFLPGIVAAVVALMVVILADYLRLEQLSSQERAKVGAQLSLVSSKLQTSVIGDVKLLQGLAAGIVVNPAMDQKAFSTLAAQILKSDSHIGSVAAAPGMVVKWVFPEFGNEKAIGLDYRTNEKQRDGAMAARNTHNVVLVGPVDLVQGGTGFIIRSPIYFAEGMGQSFWGILSGVIDLPKLYADSGLSSSDFDIAVSTQPTPRLAQQVFFGDFQIFSEDPVKASLDMAYGQWTLAAIPKGGWGQTASMTIFRICEATLAICVVGPMIWAGFLGRSRQRTIAKLQKRERELIFARRNLEHQSLHDPLTTLPNRRFMDQFLSSQRQKGSAGRVALIHIDLDGFKEINDTRGHATGDDVLRITAARLRGAIDHADIAARIGGDEFVVACQSEEPEVSALLTAQKIIAALSVPLLIDGTECRVGASAGVAWEMEAGDLSQLLNNADLALYEAKKNGRGRAELYATKLREAALRAKQQADDFARALDQDEIVVYFQPQYDAQTFELAGVEALARWHHPIDGILTPDKFLVVAEDLGRSGDLDRIVLRKALFEMARWEALGITVPRISVNVSARRLADKNLLSELSALPLRPGSLCFELLETIHFDGQDLCFIQIIEQIKGLGIDIEIDDFGTGHASILSLLRHRPKRLKIDRQFIMPIVRSSSQRRLISSIIEIGRSQDIEIIGEGVETMEHAKILRDLGCHILQGYAFARPMSSSSFIEHDQQRKLGRLNPAS